ncbi:serine hydrolase [Luteibacter sp. dw_328]|uniref:serine hydrolase n=1 Tax=Luteibacter sp. dw_328 TaxID=2719796 RepID=UPI001BD61088|nr:serine hydrolase [Luteibacter sp. dw_328]
MEQRHRSGLTLLAALLLFPVAHATSTDTPAARMAEQLKINQQRYGIAGQAVIVTHNDEVLFRGASGSASVDSVFEMYSVAKLFTNTLVMQLIEQGDVEVDQPASRYVPDLPASWKAITVRNFLDHTSGIPDYFDKDHPSGPYPPTVKAMFAALADKPLQFPPGTQTRYTQANYVVLAALLEAHYGKPYPQIVAERIVRRLGLRGTFLGASAVPADRAVTEYIGKNGKLQRDPPIVWPLYGYGHASLFSTVDDLRVFLGAMARGELVDKVTLSKLWQKSTLPNGRTGDFATGWEYGNSDLYWNVGHDGGTKVRVRLLFRGDLGGDRYTVIYVTSGSAKNVWSRVLVDSAMAAVAPDDFPAEALQERLIAFATGPSTDSTMAAMERFLGKQSALKGKDLERAVNASGYTICENLGVDACIRVFILNTHLFAQSSNAWDSLAEAYQKKGDREKAQSLYDKAHRLAAGQQ